MGEDGRTTQEKVVTDPVMVLVLVAMNVLVAVYRVVFMVIIAVIVAFMKVEPTGVMGAAIDMEAEVEVEIEQVDGMSIAIAMMVDRLGRYGKCKVHLRRLQSYPSIRKLSVSCVDGEHIVPATPDVVGTAEVARPSSAAIRPAGKRVRVGCGLRYSDASDSCGREQVESVTIVALRSEDHD
jgi:hypothetical protein